MLWLSKLRDSPAAAAFRASANAMEPLIAKNREKLRTAQRTGDGTTAGIKINSECGTGIILKTIILTLFIFILYFATSLHCRGQI